MSFDQDDDQRADTGHEELEASVRGGVFDGGSFEDTTVVDTAVVDATFVDATFVDATFEDIVPDEEEPDEEGGAAQAVQEVPVTPAPDEGKAEREDAVTPVGEVPVTPPPQNMQEAEEVAVTPSQPGIPVSEDPLEMNVDMDEFLEAKSTSAHKEYKEEVSGAPAQEAPSQEQKQEQEQEQEQKQEQESEDQLPARYKQKRGDGNELKTITTSELEAAKSAGEEGGDDANRGRIGDRLVALGVITKDQLNVAIQEKKISGKLLGEVLVELGFIDEKTLTTFLAESSGFEVFEPQYTVFDGDVLALIDKVTAVKHQILPVAMSEDEVRVAMADPYDVVALDTLRRFIPKGSHIKQLVSTPSILSEAIDAAYGYASSIQAILQELEEGKEQVDVTTLNESEAYTHPIVRLVNALIFDAVKIGVSDLHFEPEENFVRLRYRLDGVLFTAQTLHKQHWSGISQRIKIISEMNIADKLGAQDGRFSLNINGREADFRVSSLPTVHGENIVIRVLDKAASIMPLNGLGFSDDNLAKIRAAQSRPEGIIIVTGPTGSGKTTTLYSMLNEINDVEVNIQTLEDPVEYSLPMIRQTHVKEGVLDFADGIRAMLRQDPDIIFIGEIRDQTTAEMALKASMTGHQVYTTLHTNDSFGAIPRLLDLGMKPGMISGAVIAVFAQRLARRLCPSCKESYQPSEEECRLLGVNSHKPPMIYRAKTGGCHNCAGQGYKGRVAVAEVLLMDDDLDDIVADGGSKADLKTTAAKKGFKGLREDGVEKVLEGTTSIEAIARVIDLTK